MDVSGVTRTDTGTDDAKTINVNSFFMQIVYRFLVTERMIFSCQDVKFNPLPRFWPRKRPLLPHPRHSRFFRQ